MMCPFYKLVFKDCTVMLIFVMFIDVAALQYSIEELR